MKKGKTPKLLSTKLITIFTIIWALSIVFFVVILAIATKGFTTTVQDTPFGNSNLFLVIMLGSMGIGSLAFGLLVLGIIIRIILEKNVLQFERSFKGVLFFGLKLFFLLTIFPLFLLYRVSGFGELIRRFKKDGFRLTYLKPKGVKPFVGRLVVIVAISLTFLPIWIGGYWIAGTTTAYQIGYVPEDLSIVGTGSMYPTWPKGTKGKSPKEVAREVVGTAGFLKYPNGIVIAGNRILGHKIERGDIITWENDATRKLTSSDGGDPAGLLKRAIAISGDTLELRDGIVYLNNQPLKEPYIAKPRSTFGEKFLKDCQKVEVPQGHVFAMGDNRKGSADSREIGFAPISDIDYVLPFASQKGVLDKNWHDTTNDLDESSKIRLDKTRYVELLNEKRKDTGAKPLKYQPLLEKSAFKRGEVILKYDDFSYEATRSGYTQLKAMNEVGYSNIVYGEAPTLGYYEAGELVENQFEFPDTKKFLLNKEFQEVGISEVEEEINGCPAQVIVQHFAGYIPPNYKKEVIEGWKKILADLREVQPGWQGLKGQTNFYQKNKNDVDRINELISTRIANIEGLVRRMEANQWLTAAEQKMIAQDKPLYDEQETIATRLNSR